MWSSTDEAYSAGYRAGHLQGWVDALAHAAGAAQPKAAAPRAPEIPAPVTPPPATERPATRPAERPAPRREAPPQPRPFDSAGPAVPSYPSSVPARTDAELRAERERGRAERERARAKREQQSINVTLYVASLLLVAAGSLFIGTGLPAPLRFAGVCTITALFYLAGLVLHGRTPRLKPAAVAFSGTGLALIPVAGLAMDTLVLQNAPLAWLATSAVGTAAYAVAAVRLESRVLVYLSLSFLATTACSGVAVLGGALVWYFTALIGVAASFTVLAILQPRWLPPLYLRPLAQLHPFIVPAVAVAATIVPLVLGRGDYARVMAMCGCYFAVTSLAPGTQARTLQFLAARLSLTVAASVAVWDLTNRGSAALAAAAVLLAVQALAAGLRADGLGRNPFQDLVTGVIRHSRWQADVLATFACQLLVTVAFAALEPWDPLLIPAGAADGWPLAALTGIALLTGMVLAARQHGVAEWAPAGALGMAILLAGPLGAWTLAGALVTGAAFWILRSLQGAAPLRLHFVLAARLALTLAAPVVTAAAVGDNDARFQSALLALCLVLVLQQLLTAVLLRRGIRALAPRLSLALFTAAGVGAMTMLALIEQESLLFPEAEHVGGIALGTQLVASLAVGVMLFPRQEDKGSWRLSIDETVPLLVSAAAVPLAFETLALPLGNAALTLATGYLALTAARAGNDAAGGGTQAVRTGGTPRGRCYWWLARAAATALVLTLFHQLDRDAGPLLLGGEELAPATVLAVALFLQLAIPLLAALRGTAKRHDLADAAVLLVLQAAAIVAVDGGVSGFEPEILPPHAAFTLVLLSVGAAAAGYLLRLQRWSAVFAPATFVLLLLLLRGESLPAVEILLGIFAVFSAAMVVAVKERLWRGWYFAAARILAAALAVVLSYDVSASPTVVAVAFALVFAAQHFIRWAMRHRMTDVPFQQAAVWITLAGQALLPLVYLAQPFGTGPAADDGGRWVVLLSLLLLMLSAVAAGRIFAARGAVYLAVYAAAFAVIALGPLLPFRPPTSSTVLLAAPVLTFAGVASALLGLSLAATAGRLVLRRRPGEGVDRWLWLAAALTFGAASAALAPASAEWISGLAVLALSAACFAAARVEQLPGFYPPAVLAALAGAGMVAEEALGEVPGPWGFYMPWLAGVGAASVALYAAGRLRRLRLQGQGRLAGGPPETGSRYSDIPYLSLVGAAVLGFAAAGFTGLLYSATSWTGAALVATTAVVVWLEVPAAVRRPAAELGSLAVTAAVQRAVLFAEPGLPGPFRDDPFWPGSFWPDPFWTAQWYVVLAAVLGLLRYRSGHEAAGKLYVGVAAGLLSLGGLLVILGGDGAQQLWVLACFALLIVAGLGYGERLFVWWGAAGVALCIMWAMRQYTYVLLALIAAGLIALAMWRLSRGKPAGTD